MKQICSVKGIFTIFLRKNNKKCVLGVFFIALILCRTTLSYCYEPEIFMLYPALGELSGESESEYVKKATSNFLIYKKYNNKYLYDQRTQLSLNRYLIIKALEIGMKNNEEYKENLELIDKSFSEINKSLNDASINEITKSILSEYLGEYSSSEIIGITTSMVDKDKAVETYIIHLVNYVLDTDKFKNFIIYSLKINSAQYDYYKTIITGSIPVALEYINKINRIDNSYWRKLTVDSFLNLLSKNFSNLISYPLSIYEATLQTAQIGNTAAAIYELSKINSDYSVEMWATSFIYDYVNIYGGDIEKMKKDVESYTYGIWNNSDGTQRLSLTSTEYVWQHPQTNNFFDIFFWYTVFNLNYIDLSINNHKVQANLVRAAERALDMIERYGNGGNFTGIASFMMTLNEDNHKIEKKNDYF